MVTNVMQSLFTDNYVYPNLDSKTYSELLSTYNSEFVYSSVYNHRVSFERSSIYYNGPSTINTT